MSLTLTKSRMWRNRLLHQGESMWCSTMLAMVSVRLRGLTDDQILRMVNTNMLGAIRTTKAFIPHFREKRRGLFINTTSIGGSFQLHLSRDEMGAGRLERKHGN